MDSKLEISGVETAILIKQISTFQNPNCSSVGIFLFKTFFIFIINPYICSMEEGRKNLVGDLIISTTVGCAIFVGSICIVTIIGATVVAIVSVLKNLF